jgi:putative glycosyltransferase (TIGR04372 family)
LKLPYLLTPWSRNLGNCAEEIHFGLLTARREGRRLLAVRPRPPFRGRFSLDVTNAELWDVKSPYRQELSPAIDALAGLAIGAVFGARRGLYLAWRRIQRRLCALWPGYVLPPFDVMLTLPSIGRSRLWQLKSTDVFSWEAVHRLDWPTQFADPVPVSLPPRTLAEGAKVRAEMGLSDDDWFVCLHVREGGFLGDGHRGDSRNASIANYLKAIELITSRGGWVIRLGDPTMTPLPQLPRVIDYARSRWKSERIDIFLMATCRYYLGIDSGPSEVARLFRRRTALVNLSQWALAFAAYTGDVAVIKHIYSKSRGRFLSLRELLEEPFDVQSFGTPGSDYELFENTADEICAAVEELMTEPAPPLTDRQMAFNDARAQQVMRWIADRMAVDGMPLSTSEQYRIAARLRLDGAISRAYVDRNWVEDSLNGAVTPRRYASTG